MNSSAPHRIRNQTFRAKVGDRTYDLVFHEGSLTVDGTPVTYSFERVSEGYYLLLFNGRSLPVVIEPAIAGPLRVTLGDQQKTVQVKNKTDLLRERFGMTADETEALHEVRAPMPGLVLSVLVAPGEAVQAGDRLLVLEAMKMENELRAPGGGVVKTLHVNAGDAVGKNTLLVEFER